MQLYDCCSFEGRLAPDYDPFQTHIVVRLCNFLRRLAAFVSNLRLFQTTIELLVLVQRQGKS
jgi:hypothetical protein